MKIDAWSTPPQGHGFTTATLILTPPFRIQDYIRSDPFHTKIDIAIPRDNNNLTYLQPPPPNHSNHSTTLPLLLHEKVQRKITSGREHHKEDTQERYVGPPERLCPQQRHQSLSVIGKRGQNGRTWARRPKTERMVAAGRSSSTPYYNSKVSTMTPGKTKTIPLSPSTGGIAAHSQQELQMQHGRKISYGATVKQAQQFPD